MGTISKAIGAGVGGAVGGAAVSALSVAVIPEHVTAPWWAYLVVPVVTSACSALAAYWAPRNTP